MLPYLGFFITYSFMWMSRAQVMDNKIIIYFGFPCKSLNNVILDMITKDHIKPNVENPNIENDSFYLHGVLGA